jgi:hypothetical protein
VPLVARLANGDQRVRYEAHLALASITKLLKPHFKQLLCRACLTRFKLRTYTREHLSSRFIVCRLCQGVAQAMFDVKEVVAVLDTELRQELN